MELECGGPELWSVRKIAEYNSRSRHDLWTPVLVLLVERLEMIREHLLIDCDQDLLLGHCQCNLREVATHSEVDFE